MWEEEGQQQGDGLDDEIGRLASSLELIRDWPMYSPQRSPTEWCADQVLEFSVQWEWASAPMYSPQRSPTLWCFDREQFLDQPHQRESRSYRRCTGIPITISLEDILKCSRLKRNDAAKNLGVTLSTLKRNCRRLGIYRWPMRIRERKLNGCSVVEQRLLNNSDHQNSPGSEPLEVVRPLQQRNDGVVIRDNNDEQNVSLIPINEVDPLQFRDQPHQRESRSYRRCTGIPITISLEDILKCSRLKRNDAAQNLGVTLSTLKRNCRRLGIYRWPMRIRERKLNGCSVVEQRLLNNSDHQNSPGSEPLEVVQPLQDINNGFVFGNELDQNVIHIHEETERVEAMARKRKATYIGEGNENSQETERIEAMARKRKATYVGEGNENSQVRPLQQRNDGVVIRDDIDEQNVNLIPINEVQPLREINIGVVFGNELDQNVIHIHEETETIEAMARKQKATYVGKGNENSLVRPLQQRNDGVVVQRLHDFGNELDQNVIHIHEGTERIEAMARKGKATYVGEGNENSQGYSLEEGRNVEVNSLMDKKLYSGVQDIKLFQPSWPEVEIMQEDSSEQQILGELGPKNIEHKAVQKKEKGRSKKNIGHKVASAEKSCKKKNTTETPTKKYWTKRFISKEDLLQHVGRKRADAAKALGVSVSTLKRWCRKYEITCWNGDGCPRPRVEPELLNNSVLQSSPGSIPAEVRGEKETSALLRAKQDYVIIKAKYGENILKFQLSSESGVRELNKEVAKRSLLELGSFNVEYLDEDEERILIVCDEDFQDCVEFFSRSSSNQVIRLLVKNKVSNSEKSHQSCSGRKRKRS
ncbi:hypothetical protein Vadar_032817 [Vaccinium darrowii]|uniref:Uncharacterized protein n=1 Tax=Vaccinium darrowii TaxID=229202 RepID=A0ACB7ZH05_9ERIC|nr:hypothetical protein Vadar_032817 [Vaccinium darrowii]